MFLSKYLSNFYYQQVIMNYQLDYLKQLDETNFIKIYNLFLKYHFNYIEDIVLKYLEIFTLDEDEVEEQIIKLKEHLGNDFVSIISKNITYLNQILQIDEM